jgi:hypothetical protein
MRASSSSKACAEGLARAARPPVDVEATRARLAALEGPGHFATATTAG